VTKQESIGQRIKRLRLEPIIVAGALGAFAIYTWGWHGQASTAQLTHVDSNVTEAAVTRPRTTTRLDRDA
jgi:hypothetical protein